MTAPRADEGGAGARRRIPVGLTVATVLALAVLIALGGWQLQRLSWKRALLADIGARAAAAPAPLSRAERAEFVRVTAVCPGLTRAPFVEQYALVDGEAGSRLISVCRAPDLAQPVLVDRGFLPDSVTARPAVAPGAAEVVTVTGVLRGPDPERLFTPATSQNRFFRRDIEGMARALGVRGPVLPFMLVTERPTDPGMPALRPAPLPATISNRHLEYALTWFGLAGALAAVYLARLFGKR